MIRSQTPVIAIILLAAVLLPGSAAADVPRLVSYQGKLAGEDAGPVNLDLTLYDSAVGGAALFSESHVGVPLNVGIFSILIGAQTLGGLPDSALNAAEVWLGVSVDGGAELTPRTRIAMVPYAAKAAAAERLVRPDSFAAVAATDTSGRLDFAIGDWPLMTAGHDNDVLRPKRMWIGHSPALPAWGIQYRDLASDGRVADSIEFVAGNQSQPRFAFELSAGNVSIFDSSGNAAIKLNSNTVGTAGEISMLAADGLTETVEIAAAESSTQGSRMRLGLPDGTTTITLDADFLSLDTPAITLADAAQTNLLLSGSAGGSISFGAGDADPLIVAGHDNNAARPKRMWIGHSTGAENWGIQYRDLVSDGFQNDAIEFVAGDTTMPVFRFDLPGRRMHLSDGTYDTVDLYASGGGGGSALTLRSSAGAATVVLDSDESDDAASLQLFDGINAAATIDIDAREGTTGGAAMYLYNRLGVNTIEIDGNESNDASAIRLGKADGTQTVEIVAAETSTQGAQIELRRADGTATITLDADFSGDGRIITQELQITGGSDLSEQFEVSACGTGLGPVSPEPGLVVCIDPAHPAELVVSRRAYDRTVAGVISGAGGVKPGMLMGQSGTVADGAHPVALTGRVWCWCDATYGAIEVGDRLTTSATPGHAMKAANPSRCPGAVVGKAMTPLAEGRGLVLVLVQPQ